MQTGAVPSNLADDPGQPSLFVHGGRSELYGRDLSTSPQLDEQPSLATLYLLQQESLYLDFLFRLLINTYLCFNVSCTFQNGFYISYISMIFSVANRNQVAEACVMKAKA